VKAVTRHIFAGPSTGEPQTGTEEAGLWWSELSILM
jgi:hypothetical protein